MNIDKRAGFTLIEVMVSVVILIMMLGMAFMIAITNQRVAASDILRSDLEDKARMGMETIMGELRYAATEFLNPSLIDLQPGASELRFQKVESYNSTTGVPEYSTLIEFTTKPMDGEILGDGIDNNGNGLTDESKLVRIKDGKTTTIRNNVSKIEFLATKVSDNRYNLKISLTLQGVDTVHDNAVITVPLADSIYLRN